MERAKGGKTPRTGCMIVTAPVCPQSLQKVIKVLTLVRIFYQLSGLTKAQRKIGRLKTQHYEETHNSLY